MLNSANNKNIYSATRWSTITQIVLKVISPIINMVLARLISPEAFGVVAMVTMVFSFVDMFTDAGFQKYLIQHEFKSENDKNGYTNVAFYTNLSLSIFLLCLIFLFRNPIAVLVGAPGMGVVIVIACIQLVFTSFSSIQIALYRRDMDFKNLFFSQLIAAFIPVLVTIPLALLGFSYWSIIIGSIIGEITRAVTLTINSKWKPSLFYSFKKLHKMLSFSIWSLVEALSIWLTSWVDIFLVGISLSQYDLGIYRISISLVNGLMAVVTASITPILFSALSRLQDDKLAFERMFFEIQKIFAYLVFPLGVGLFLFRNQATNIMLGSQWVNANNIIGIWSLTSAITIVLAHLNGEVYRAKGKPKLSFFIQISHLIFLVPTCLISLRYGFDTFVISRSLIRFQFILSNMVVLNYIYQIKGKDVIKNVAKPFAFTIIMGIQAIILLKISDTQWWSFISIVLCMALYGSLTLIFAKKDVNLLLKFVLRSNNIE